MPIEIAIASIIAYLFGSLSTAIIVCRLFKLPDPRSEGSMNPGATNVLRIGGKLPAIMTLAGDMLKGAIPVLLAKEYGLPSTGLALVTLAAVLGHLYPLFFRFRGGKGVATVIGCLLALSPCTGLCWIATWLIMAILFRYSSLASLTATSLSPLVIWLCTANLPYTAMLSIIAAILIYRHRDNIRKICAGTENRLGSRKPL